MATTTPNFGWSVPTSTDLVKDGATAIETLGDSIDASLVDLKGGTSGQILAKNSNTDMDFIWVTNDVGDITAVTAGTGISGGGTSGAVTITNSMATAITTNGDTLYGTGSGTFTRLGIGSTGQVLTVASGVPSWATPATSGFVGASMYHAAFNISLTNATSTKLTWTDAEEMWDTSSFHTQSAGTRITIPSGKAGYYTINFGVGWDANASNRRVVNVLKNNTDNLLSVETTSGTTYYPSTYGTVVASLSVGDYLEVQAYQDSGGTINCGKSLFQVVYLGA
jgi:hypothetical protein